MKNLFTFLFLIFIGLGIGAGLMMYAPHLFGSFLPQTKSEVSSSVLLEKIRKVYKVILVEGEFADIINYRQNYRGFDIPGFRKKAIVKVKAKVSVGYDLDQLKIEADPTQKIITISNLPSPEILAIDSKVSYYDLDDGFFNEFTEKELTELNRIARDTIEANVSRSSMMEAARNQTKEMFGLVTLMAKENGWSVAYENFEGSQAVGQQKKELQKPPSPAPKPSTKPKTKPQSGSYNNQ